MTLNRMAEIVNAARNGRRFAFLAALSAAIPGFATAVSADAPILSIDITHPPDEPFEDAVAAIKRAGATATSLSLFWDDLETEPGVYAPEFDWPALANAYYPTEDLSLTVTFSVIDTVADRRREDLQGRDWDDPETIAAFEAHVTDVLSRMPDADILTISIGNEIDALLRTDAEIAAFARFLAVGRTHLETLRPGVTVGAKITFGSLAVEPARWRPVLDAGTALHLTYYPLEPDFSLQPDLSVADDVATMIRVAEGLPVYILEAGYPSEGCGSEPGGQESFVRDLVTTSTGISLVSLTWLTDIPRATVGDLAVYYGVDDPCFSSFVGSIGLRSDNGDAKPAFRWLTERP